MLPADLDDEQRAHLAHEHPNDLDSTPSSPSSSRTPTFFDSRRRSKRHRSHTTTDGSSSSHLLARLVSREEEVREINAALAVTSERLEGESSRANAAERRALDYFHRLRIATENREHAEHEAARLREELKLYKLQLENAQKEIFRAQDIIDQVASQRNEAEAEAARARTKARKLQEEKLVMLAREEGRRMGYREGLSMGRRIGYDEGTPEQYDDDENVLEPGETDEERDDPRSHIQLRPGASIRHPPTRSESAPPVRTSDTTLHAPPLPVPSPVVPVRVHTPSHGHRTSSPSRGPDEPETIRPIPIQHSPIVSPRPISVPIDDGWIPRADSRTSYISIPPPYELQRMHSPGSVAGELQDRRPTPQSEPTPVPPPGRSREYSYQPSAPPPVPRGHTPSLASRVSTHISQYDIVNNNNRPGSSLRNEIYAGRARRGSHPSRESTSRNEHRGHERRHSSRTEAENIAEQWRGDPDPASPPRNPSRSYTPAPIPHPHRPPNNYYRPREIVTPSPLGDVDERSRTPVPTEPTASRPHPPLDDPASNAARARTPVEYFRQRQRERPASGGSGSIPNIIVQSPSEPDTTMSPTATMTQPELLSPEAANRPLPQDDVSQHHQHQHQHYHHHHPPSTSQSQSHQSHQSHHRHHSHDAVPRSGTPYSPLPVGFVPYPPGYGTTSSTTSHSKSGPERDPRRAYANPTPHPNSGADVGRSQNGYVRTRTHGYDASPVPAGVTYPAPPVRPHTSHRHHRDRDRGRDRDRERDRVREGDQDWDRDRDRDRDRERDRDVRDWDWERERDRDWERRRDPARDYHRERERERNRDRDRAQDTEGTGLDEELTRSPAPLQRPISLFDSDEA